MHNSLSVKKEDIPPSGINRHAGDLKVFKFHSVSEFRVLKRFRRIMSISVKLVYVGLLVMIKFVFIKKTTSQVRRIPASLHSSGCSGSCLQTAYARFARHRGRFQPASDDG